MVGIQRRLYQHRSGTLKRYMKILKDDHSKRMDWQVECIESLTKSTETKRTIDYSSYGFQTNLLKSLFLVIQKQSFRGVL